MIASDWFDHGPFLCITASTGQLAADSLSMKWPGPAPSMPFAYLLQLVFCRDHRISIFGGTT